MGGDNRQGEEEEEMDRSEETKEGETGKEEVDGRGFQAALRGSGPRGYASSYANRQMQQRQITSLAFVIHIFAR